MFSFGEIRRKIILSVALIACLMPASPVAAMSRIKDIADFEGVRDNMLVGYGLVVGLNGTGDSLTSSVFTKESLIGMLERLGINARDDALKTKNVAAVMVTATLPPFSRQGSRIDITVATIGDAKSLLGGTLMVTPLLGADGEVYAVSQGQIAAGGFTAEGKGGSVTRGVPTNGRIANGAIIERELPFQMKELQTLKIALRNPDFTTSSRVAEAINSFVGAQAAKANDPGTIVIEVPEKYQKDSVAFITDIEQLRIAPDQLARVVIDEQSGIIVMGENVRINTVAIAQGNLTIKITETPQVSQPNAFSETGETTTVDRTKIEVDDDSEKRMTIMRAGISIQDLVVGLNALGIGPRDMISILQAIKAAGAMQADIEVM
ncbi:MAG: flagellar basal body P-ring protein FlgI [Alphaproteobacteria bacterium]|nr:MAG: flagellar basal body P-ring protein FlgI [Alphaproteobacteria bacterium]